MFFSDLIQTLNWTIQWITHRRITISYKEQTKNPLLNRWGHKVKQAGSRELHRWLSYYHRWRKYLDLWDKLLFYFKTFAWLNKFLYMQPQNQTLMLVIIINPFQLQVWPSTINIVNWHVHSFQQCDSI